MKFVKLKCRRKIKKRKAKALHAKKINTVVVELPPPELRQTDDSSSALRCTTNMPLTINDPIVEALSEQEQSSRTVKTNK